MARINLLLQLQQQKLLAENKERAGHNRSAKEDRNRTTKTADKASAPPATTAAAQAKQADDARKKRQLSGGSLDLYKRRRPAATGSDDEEFRFFGITKREPFVLPNSTVSFSGEWTATAEADRDYAAGTYAAPNLLSAYKAFYSALQRTNNYEYNTTAVAPKFFEELGANEKEYINTPEMHFPFSMQYLDWTLDQASAPAGGGGVPNNPVVGTPPILAAEILLSFLKFESSLYDFPNILRSNGRFIYYSRVVKTIQPKRNYNFEAGTRDFTSYPDELGRRSAAADTRYNVMFNEGETYVLTSGVAIQLREAIRFYDVYEYEYRVSHNTFTSGIYRPGKNNEDLLYYSDPVMWSSAGTLLSATGHVTTQGLYWRYDTEAENPNDAISFRQVDLSDIGPTYATRKSPLSNFLDNLDSSNPVRIIWEYNKSLNTTGLPLELLAFYFKSTNENTLTLESYPERFVYNQSTGIATEVLGSYVYTLQLEENLAYEIAASLAKNTPKSEWEESRTYDEAPDVYVQFAHRST